FSVYLGAPVVVLAAVAVVRERSTRAIAAIAAVALVIALGRYTPLYRLYRAVVVPERFVRYPEKHVGAVVVLIAAVAGVGFSRAFSGARVRRLAAIFAAAAVAFAVGRAFGAALAAAAVGAALVVRRPSLALAAIAMHLAIEGWAVQPLVPREALTRIPPLLAAVAPSAPPRPRLYRPAGLVPRSNARTRAESSVAERDTGLENAAAPFGFAHIPGFDAALDPRWHAVWDAGVANGARLLERFDVQWVVLSAATVKHTPFVPRAELGGLVLAENPRRRPRAFVATRAHAGADGVLIDDVAAPCAIGTSRPEAVDVTCTAPAAGHAVLLDAMADGWRATVDGAPAPIVRADEVARAVPIAAGTHVIAFRYRTPGLRAGALVSLLGWLAWLALVAWLRPRSA
ncbi:MAG TPA: YfhO family protein, partial [Polyangia bacterium]